MKILAKFEKNKFFWIILSICFVFFLLRLPSLFEPNWYGDEGIYQTIGYGLRAGRQFYTGVRDNKPPMLFIIYALANGDQFTARVFSLLFGFGAVVTFFLLSGKLFKELKIQIITTSFLALFFGLPIIEGNIANSENFMLFPILVAAYSIYYLLHNHETSRKVKFYYFLTGVILSFSFLIKIVSIFDFAAFLTFSFFNSYVAKNITVPSLVRGTISTIRRVFWFVVGFIFPVLVSITMFCLLGVLPYYLDAAFGRNVDYVGWANRFIVPQGLLYIRVFILGVSLVFLFIKRHAFEKRTLFILIWFAFALFNAFFSFRPYTHYQLVLLPSFSLLIGLLFLKQTLKQKLQSASLVIVCFLLIFFHFDHWSIGRTYAYYENFTEFILQKKDVNAYQSFFDPRTPKDYAIAEYIEKLTTPHDVILLWGNSSQIYPLSQTHPVGRYGAAYHIGTNKRNVAETEAAIKKMKPKYIIITSDERHVPFNMSGYTYLITVEDAHFYERSF